LIRLWSLAIALLVVLAPHAHAQARDTDRFAAVRSLEVGQHVRLDITRSGRLEGQFAVSSDSSLTLVRHNAPTEVRLPDVERLWVRGRATGRGALIGAGVGAVAGVVYGLLISQVACEPVDGGDCTAAELAAIAGLLGGAGGAVVGAGVGFAVPVWRLRFP